MSFENFALSAAVVVSFFVCWAPFHTQRLLHVFIYSYKSVKARLIAQLDDLCIVLWVLSELITEMEKVIKIAEIDFWPKKKLAPKNGPRITQNCKKWPKNDPKLPTWPKNDPKWPKHDPK